MGKKYLKIALIGRVTDVIILCIWNTRINPVVPAKFPNKLLHFFKKWWKIQTDRQTANLIEQPN